MNSLKVLNNEYHTNEKEELYQNSAKKPDKNSTNLLILSLIGSEYKEVCKINNLKSKSLYINPEGFYTGPYKSKFSGYGAISLIQVPEIMY